MADLFTVTAPLMIRLPSGERRVMAERFPHPMGLLYFDLFWHVRDPSSAIHLVEGEIRGDGPWKIGAHVVTVLGCQGTHGECASDYDAWRLYLLENSDAYPARPLIHAIARRHGARTP